MQYITTCLPPPLDPLTLKYAPLARRYTTYWISHTAPSTASLPVPTSISRYCRPGGYRCTCCVAVAIVGHIDLSVLQAWKVPVNMCVVAVAIVRPMAHRFKKCVRLAKTLLAEIGISSVIG